MFKAANGILAKSTSLTSLNPQQLLRLSQRGFAKPAAKGGGKGGPPDVAVPPPKIREPTLLQKMVDEGVDFPLGPPKVLNKRINASRQSLLHKLEPHIDIYARKLREMYMREGSIPQTKSYLNPMRMRQPTDTLEECKKEKVIPGVIHGRDEFSDLDLVWNAKIPHRVTRSMHSFVRPWYMIHPETEEEVRVTCSNIDYGIHNRLPYYIEFQRYIVGRPNLIEIPIVPVQEDKSLHFDAGAAFNYHVKTLWVWCFNDNYPGRIDIDCAFLSPNMSIKIGDVEKMLPYGMYLHKKYNNSKFHSVVSLKPTNKYVGRRNLIVE